jgi:hypothetical protein
MNSKTPFAAVLAAFALTASACTITTTPAAAEKPKPAAETTTAKAGAPSKSAVPEPPKTPAPTVTPKPAKAEAVPASRRKQPAAPDSWTTVQDDDFGIQFRVPSHWNADTRSGANGNVFIAAPPDESMVLAVVNFENSTIADEQILANLLDSMGFEPDGEYERIDDGLIVAHGTGNDGGEPVYFVAMVYAYDNANYVTYIVTPEAKTSENGSTMRQILESFELI